MHIDIEQKVKYEFNLWQASYPEKIEAINSGSASNRKYFRIRKGETSFIATYNSDLRENQAFFYLGDYFRLRNIRLPKILYRSECELLYFQEDLGDECLLQKLKEDGLTEEVKGLYTSSLTHLAQMQASARQLNFSKCYPRPSFDEQSILWDLNYFKYYFLKVSGLLFDEQKLEDDMRRLAQLLAVKDQEQTFMFRDFQARNIQIFQSEAFFIDFQGGRRGPVAYDVASILYQASANLPDDFRNELKQSYFKEISTLIDYSEEKFESDLNRMIFIRIIQTLGAYGFRGLIEGKEYFKNSIQPALLNLENHLNKWSDRPGLIYFFHVLEELFKIKDKFDN